MDDTAVAVGDPPRNYEGMSVKSPGQEFYMTELTFYISKPVKLFIIIS